MVLTAEQAFKISQKGAIREEKKSKTKEFRLAIKKIRKAARQGETEIHLYLISYSTEGKLNKLGYKTKCYGDGVNVSWEEAETSVTGRRREVFA